MSSFVFFLIWFSPIIIYLVVRYIIAKPNDTVKDLFNSIECQNCKQKLCLYCDESDYPLECVLLIIPFFGILVMIKLLFWSYISRLWKRFMNMRIK